MSETEELELIRKITLERFPYAPPSHLSTFELVQRYFDYLDNDNETEDY